MLRILTDQKFALSKGSFFLFHGNTWPSFRLGGNFEVAKFKFIRSETVLLTAGPQALNNFCRNIVDSSSFDTQVRDKLASWFWVAGLKEKMCWFFLEGFPRCYYTGMVRKVRFILFSPWAYVFCHVYEKKKKKKSLKMLITSVWSVTTFPPQIEESVPTIKSCLWKKGFYGRPEVFRFRSPSTTLIKVAPHRLLF